VLAGVLALGKHTVALITGGIIMLAGLALAEGRLRLPRRSLTPTPAIQHTALCE
jgi:hypothetical protein